MWHDTRVFWMNKTIGLMSNHIVHIQKLIDKNKIKGAFDSGIIEVELKEIEEIKCPRQPMDKIPKTLIMKIPS